jgi:hypothetical protein
MNATGGAAGAGGRGGNQTDGGSSDDAGAAQCPAEQPTDGSSCSSGGTRCGYDGGACMCARGRWRC